MSDIYGTEPHDHESGHDEVLKHEDEVHEPPSDYEFADDHGGAAASEEHADEQSILAGDVPPRRSLLPILAAVGGVLLLGGVAWWQFGGNTPSSSPPPSETASFEPIPVNPAAAPKTADNAASVTPPQSTVAPKTASASSLASAAAVASADSAKPAALSETAAIPAAPTPAPVVPAPKPIAAAPANKNLMPAPAAAPLVPVVAAMPGAPSVSNAVEDQRISALGARMDDIQKSLAQTTQQLGQMTNVIAAMSVGGNAAPAPANKETQERLDRLEQEITQLRSAKATHATPRAAAPAAEPVTQTAVAASAPKPAAAPRHRKAVHAAATVTPKTDKSQPPVVIITAPTSWVLRAASPGQAWVATNASSHDLKEVHVGDTLAGVGRVTVIQQQAGGNWVVQGTRGSIQ